MATEPDDDSATLRDALDAAFEQHSTDDAPSTPESTAPEAAAPAEAPAQAGDAEARARARDEHGRFAPKGPAAAAGAPAAAPAGTGVAPAVGAPAPQPGGELKPPASWRPEAREKWSSVDPSVRQEIHRREYEAQHVLQETAQARQFIGAFERIVAPYEMFIRQENSNPLQAVQNLMQTAADLRVGPPQHKAALVADIITRYSVDLEMLDKLLQQARDGGTLAIPQQGAAQQQPLRDPRFDQFLAQQQEMLQQQAQQQDGQMRAQLADFGAKHEFYRDVAGVMADIVEVRARQGQSVDLEKIYAQACQMHDGVSTILTQRGAAAKANGHSAAVLRAKRAAVSVKGDSTPDGATVPKDDSVRAALEAAFESAGRA